MYTGPAVIFDLDGTLTDSKPGILNCLRTAIDASNITYDGSLEWFIGPPTNTWAAKLMPNADKDTQDHLLTTFRTCYEAEGWAQNSVYDGIPELLTALREQGASLYVCTSKGEKSANRILANFHLDHYFRAIYGNRPEFAAGKSALLAHMLREEQIEASSAWMVGDRLFDMAAAKSNGLRSIGVTWGYGSEEELMESGADVLCSQPGDVLHAVYRDRSSVPSVTPVF